MDKDTIIRLMKNKCENALGYGLIVKLDDVINIINEACEGNNSEREQVIELLPYVMCSNCPRTIGLTVGKCYQPLAKHKDLIAIINDYGDFKIYNECYF